MANKGREGVEAEAFAGSKRSGAYPDTAAEGAGSRAGKISDKEMGGVRDFCPAGS